LFYLAKTSDHELIISQSLVNVLLAMTYLNSHSTEVISYHSWKKKKNGYSKVAIHTLVQRSGIRCLSQLRHKSKSSIVAYFAPPGSTHSAVNTDVFGGKVSGNGRDTGDARATCRSMACILISEHRL
jgi:hypothetical protein